MDTADELVSWKGPRRICGQSPNAREGMINVFLT